MKKRNTLDPRKLQFLLFKSIVDFIRELYDTPKNPIYLHEPVFVGKEKEYLLEAIDSTFVSSVGPFVNRFEEMMTELTGAKYAIAVVNGTAALHTALSVTGVGQGDEVITQPLNFVAAANAISYQNAVPHFVDVDEDSLGMSPTALKMRLEQIAIIRDGKCYNEKTGNHIAACIPMHVFGQPLRIDEIVGICNEYHIPVIEDAAEAMGSYYKRRHTGTFGQLGIFSFNGNKMVTCGGGGALVTDDEQLAILARHITTTAKMPHQWEYRHDQTGYNYRMPNLNAALACAQLEQLEKYKTIKRKTATAYQEFFDRFDTIHSIVEIANSVSNYWLNAIRFDTKEERTAFLEYTNAHDVMTRPVWQLMNRLRMFEHCQKGDLPVAEALESTVVNIPSSVRI